MMYGPDQAPFSDWWKTRHRPRQHPRIADDQYRLSGKSVVQGLLGMLPGVGEAMDAWDVGKGLLTGDPMRVGTGLLGAALPFATGRSLRSAARGADDLPMDEASRMARAREQGFDVGTTLYHGTDADFDAFRASRGGEVGPGVYTTTDADEANSYVRGREGGNILPLVGPSEDRMFHGTTEEFWERFGRGDSDADAVRRAQEAGFDGIVHRRRVQEWRDGVGVVDLGRWQEHRIVFDPQNVRSRFARFDPRNADSADLLAGLSGLGLLGAYRAQRER